MEKIKHKPLIEHLKRTGDQYDQLCRHYEMRFGAIPSAVLTSWIVRIIEPIITATTAQEAQAGKIFQVLYKNILQLLGNQLAMTYEQEYRSAWMILAGNPQLMQTSPSRLVNAINSALLSFRRFQPNKVLGWIASMGQTIQHCNTVEEFLACGRVYAWLCGMAHLREKAIADVSVLRDDLKDLIESNSGQTLHELTGKQWRSATPVFAGVAGGFTGLSGAFITPPQVALIDNQIVATDNKYACALFADAFGSVLLPGLPITVQQVNGRVSQDAFRSFVSRFGTKVVPFEDVSSSVMKDNTLVITRQTSFHLFIYGWHA